MAPVSPAVREIVAKALNMRWIIGGLVLFAAFFALALRAMDGVSPAAEPSQQPASPLSQPAPPPLARMVRTSTIFAPVTIADTLIRDAVEGAAPHDLGGRRDNVFPELLSKGVINWTMTRGTLGVGRRGDALAVTAPVTGTMRLTGQLGGQYAGLARGLAGLAGPDIGQAVQRMIGRPFEQRADTRGTVAILARPLLTPAWRIEPNLSSDVRVVDFSLPISGGTLNVGRDVKPMIDRSVNAELDGYAARIRGDDSLEQAARGAWQKLCRSISLKSQAPGMPDLWLEIRPVRALAAQPSVGTDSVNLAAGIEAETRVVPAETQPDCPFPTELTIVPAPERGHIGVALAIDVPFAEINPLLEKELVGRSFPENGSGPVVATIENATVAGAGDRLLLALHVKARETRWFGVLAPADVLVRARPVIDRDNQVIRLTDFSADVRSDAGLLATALRAAVPFLQAMLADKAAIDLKPLATNARHNIEAAIEGFTKADQGVHVDAGISALRLTGIDYDATTLRLVAELEGTIAADMAALPK